MTTVATHLSPAEYLAIERLAATRSEYVDGTMRPRHGPSRGHNLLVTQLGTRLAAAIANKPYETCLVDMRVRIPDGPYYYPDAVIAPSPPRMEDDEQDTLLNPLVVVEVLSPTTEAIDRGEKLDNYRRIPTLTDYLLVAQDRLRVDHYSRLSATEWRLVSHETPDAQLTLSTPNATLTLADIYSRWLQEQNRPQP